MAQADVEDTWAPGHPAYEACHGSCHHPFHTGHTAHHQLRDAKGDFIRLGVQSTFQNQEVLAILLRAVLVPSL